MVFPAGNKLRVWLAPRHLVLEATQEEAGTYLRRSLLKWNTDSLLGYFGHGATMQA